MFPKLVEQRLARRALCRSAASTRDDHLARYGGTRDDRKSSALAMRASSRRPCAADAEPERPHLRLRIHLRAPTSTRTARARRASSGAARSSPDFNAGKPGYGVGGLLADLDRHRPAVRRAAAARLGARRQPTRPSSSWQPPLAGWLRADLRAGRPVRRLRRLGAERRAMHVTAPSADLSPRAFRHRCSAARGGIAARASSLPPIRLAIHRRRRVARRRRVGPQRAQQGALRGVDAGRVEPDVHRAGVHRRSSTPRSRRSASACARRGWSRSCCGLLSVLLLALGVGAARRRARGLIAGALLATNYVYVMYDRAAIMEAPMVAFMVASWYCSRGRSARRLGRGRGAAWRCWRSSPRRRRRSSSPRSRSTRCSRWWLGGRATAGRSDVQRFSNADRRRPL